MRSRTLILALLLVAAPAGPCLAHRVNVFAYLEKGRVICEAYMQDGAPCKGCALKFYDRSESMLHTGTTDEKGRYAFEAPPVDELLVVLDAGRGHRAEYRLRLSGKGPAPKKASAPPQEPPPSGKEPHAGRANPAELTRRIDDLSSRVDGLGKEVGLLRQERKGVTVEKVLLGVAVLLALGAFVTALRSRGGSKDR